MKALTAKQQEIQARGEKILEVSRPMIVREGYHGLSMDRIADAVGYSKGTIYNHFSCKEEIIIALAVQTAAKRVELFRRAAEYQGKPRFRMLAIGLAAEIFVRDFPDHFMFEEIVQLPSVRAKTSEKRQTVIQGCEMQCMSIAAGIVRDAVAKKQLRLSETTSPEELVFGLWSLTSGAYSIILKSDSLAEVGLVKPFETVRNHTAAIMDGFNWKPLSKSYDRDEVLANIRAEVFGRD